MISCLPGSSRRRPGSKRRTSIVPAPTRRSSCSTPGPVPSTARWSSSGQPPSCRARTDRSNPRRRARGPRRGPSSERTRQVADADLRVDGRRAARERDVAQVDLELADAELVVRAAARPELSRPVVAAADTAAQRYVEGVRRSRSRRAAASPTRISVWARPTNAAVTSAAPTTHVADREHDGEVHVERAGGLQQARDARRRSAGC